MRFHALGLAVACSLPGLLSCSGPRDAESVGEATAAASNNGATVTRTTSGPEAFASFSEDTSDPCLFVNTFLDATQDPSGNGNVYAAYENYNFCTGALEFCFGNLSYPVQISPSLRHFDLAATVPVSGSCAFTSIAIDLTWSGAGGMTTQKTTTDTVYRAVAPYGHYMMRSLDTMEGTSRNANVAGTVTFSDGTDGTFGSSGFSYGIIAINTSRSLSHTTM